MDTGGSRCSALQDHESIHAVCHRTAEKYGTPGNYVNGANIASFLKVANAMMDQGLV